VLKVIELTVSEGEPNIVISATFDVQYYEFVNTEKHASTSATYSAYPSTVSYLLWSDVGITKSNFNVNGSILNIQELSISVNQNYEKVFTLANVNYAKSNVVQGYDVTGSMTALYKNLTDWHNEEDKLDGNLSIAIARTTSNIDIILDKMILDSISVDSAPNEMQTLDVSYTAELCDFA